MVVESFLDALGAGGTDAPVDRKRLPQVRSRLETTAVLEMASSDPFEGTCFLERHADFAGDGECLSVVMAARAGVCSLGG